MTPARLALVAAGGDAIGLGHVVRSRRLADALERAGAQVERFAVNSGAEALFGPRLDPGALSGCAAVSLDVPRRHRLAAAQEVRAAAPGAALVLIGGPSEADPLGDLLIRQTLSRDETGARIIAGPDALLAPPALFEDRPAPRRKAASGLFCLGGGGREGYADIAQALTLACPELIWRLAGPQGEETAAGLAGRRVEAVPSDALAAAMLRADLAVIGGGGLVHEAAAARLPAIYLPLASNQHETVRLASKAGLGRAVARDAAPATIARAAADLARDADARARMHDAALAMMRPGGPERCAEAVLAAAGLTAS